MTDTEQTLSDKYDDLMSKEIVINTAGYTIKFRAGDWEDPITVDSFSIEAKDKLAEEISNLSKYFDQVVFDYIPQTSEYKDHNTEIQDFLIRTQKYGLDNYGDEYYLFNNVF